MISPLLANLYLHPVDVAMRAAGYEMIRYADDLVILCRSESEAHGALELIGQLTAARGLTLHPEKTRMVDVSIPGEGLTFWATISRVAGGGPGYEEYEKAEGGHSH